MMAKLFKYVLFPDKIYQVEFEDLRGNPFTVDILGSEIISQIRRPYVLDRLLEELSQDQSPE